MQSGHTQELFVADLDMTLDDLDESYADRPATTMRVPLPTHVQFSERRADGSSNVENVELVRSNEALKVCFNLWEAYFPVRDGPDVLLPADRKCDVAN